MGFGTLNFCFLHAAQFHSVVAALGFRHDTDTLHSTFVEGDGPVGAVFT